MKNYEIKPALDACKKVKMPSITDKNIRNTLIKNHFALLKAGRKFDEEAKDLHTVHLGAYEEELAKMQELEGKLQREKDRGKQKALADELAKYEKVYDAIRAYNKAMKDKSEEEVEITLIDGDKFVEAFADEYDAAVVEGLMPMFK